VLQDGWVDQTLRISGRPLTVSVRLLSEAEREAIGGKIAWLSAAATDAEASEHTAWRVLIQDIVAQHVTFTVDESTRRELDPRWWAQAVEEATAALIEINRLEEPIRRWSTRDFPPGKVNRFVS
jgi:hypothetical protein